MISVFKKIISTFLIFLSFLLLAPPLFAQDVVGQFEEALLSQPAFQEYMAELSFLNDKLSPDQQLTQDQIQDIAMDQVGGALMAMGNSQEDVWRSFETLEERVLNLPDDDPRRQVVGEIMGDTGRFGAEVKEAFEDVFGSFTQGADKTDVETIDTFLALLPGDHIEITPSIGGSLPIASANDTFRLAEQMAKEILSQANQAMLTPLRPGEVPEGDLIRDFIPRAIRLLFRFAWFMVFISFVVSGAIFVVGASKEEWLEKGKKIAYYSVIGFALVSLSFAIVKAITDIDFFRIF